MVLVLVTVSACGAHSPGAAAVVVDARDLGVAASSYWAPSWADENTIVVSMLLPTNAGEGRRRGEGLATIDLDTGDVAAVPVEWTDGCDWISDRRPRRLDDGRIAFIRDCVVDESGVEPLSIHAVHLAAGASTLVTELGDPWAAEGWRTDVGWFSFRPGLVDGVVGVGSTICDGAGRIADGSVQPLSLAVPEDPSANLSDIWTGACADAVNARFPTWSPDGRLLALAIAPGAKGGEDWSRMDAPFRIYVVDGENLHLLTTGIHDVIGLDWAPDGETIAVLEGTDEPHRTNTWLIDVATGCRTLLTLADGRSLEGFAFSLDGRRFAGIVHADRDPLAALFAPVVADVPVSPLSCV